VTATEAAPDAAAGSVGEAPRRGHTWPVRWSPFAAAVAVAVALLLGTGTAPLDILRYGAYATLAVALPGTLVYRALRRTPHTFVEDVAMGVAVGLALELGAWAAFSAVHLQNWLVLWPAAVVVPFAAAPGLRRHWRVRGYAETPLGWSWAVAGAVAFFTVYLWSVFLARNPILPTSDGTQQYLDLAYQLSLAGEAKHAFPLHVPQVAAEPLYYHWFGEAHMGVISLVGHIDLPVVALRFAVPGLSAAAIVLTAVVGWRVSGRPHAGAVAAVLFWVIGEFNFTDPANTPFGTEATFVIWHGMSMIYSWVLLIALIGVLADIVGPLRASRVPRVGRGAFVVAALLLLASSGAKASSLPIVLCGLGVAGLAVAVSRRRIPWAVLVAIGIGLAAELFAVVVLFRFQSYGLFFAPLDGIKGYWFPTGAPRPEWKQWVVEAAVVVAFALNMHLREAAVVPLLWLRRLRLEPVHWLLLGGGLAGPALFLTFGTINAEYFTRSGFTFGVLLSACGYVLVFERARLSRRWYVGLGAVTAVFALVLVAIELRFAGPAPTGRHDSGLVPIWKWAAALGAVAVVGALAWLVLRYRVTALRGRGGVVLLSLMLVAGVPGLVLDQYQGWRSPNGGAYFNIPLPRSRVDAARWVRDHSDPGDVLATNAHCLDPASDPTTASCDARVFWLSAYAERRVLVEGWSFAPRMAATFGLGPFWDQGLLRLNDKAFDAPDPALLTELRQRYHVRWLVVDRTVRHESPALAQLARSRFDNGRLAVYELP
jgi:hypothetical protein